MIDSKYLTFGGTLERTTDTVAAVSFWNLPGGYNASEATAVHLYFNDQKNATAFTEKFNLMPEMAIELSMPVIKQSVLINFERLLKEFDWYYDFSDDHKVWDQGFEGYRKILRLVKDNGMAFEEAYNKAKPAKWVTYKEAVAHWLKHGRTF